VKVKNPLEIIEAVKPQGIQAEEFVKLRNSFDRLTSGTADTDDFDTVAMSINFAKVRALEISEKLAELLTQGQLAMTSVRNRYVKWRKWQMTDADRSSILDAIEAYEAIVAASSKVQMNAAVHATFRSLAKNKKGKYA
jgi:hypothetical protein